MAVEVGRPAAAAALISLGYLLIGLSVATGLARTATFGEIAAAALLIALAVIDRSWETFTLALFGPIVAGATLAGVLASPEAARPSAATLAAFFGIIVTWLALCAGGVRENLYPNGASLDGICAAIALLAVNRGLLAVRLPARSARAASAALLGALAVGLSVFLRPAPGVPAGRSLSSPIVAMTFNIHRGVGSDRALDLERIERVITAARPDLVGIQEVSRGRKTEAGIDEFAGWLNSWTWTTPSRRRSAPAWAWACCPPPGSSAASLAGFALGGGRGVLIAEVDAGPSLTVAVSQLASSWRARQLEAQSLAAADTRGDALLLLDLSSGALDPRL